MSDSDRRVQVAEAERITGIERTTIWRKCRAGAFPLPLYILGRRTWLESELAAWVAAQGERTPEHRAAFRHLVPSPVPAANAEPCSTAGESPSTGTNGAP